MRLSQAGLGVTRLQNLDEMYPAQDILLQSGQLVQYAAGVYAYNNIPLGVKKKVEEVIRECLDECGCIEVQLPTLQPEAIWQASNRWSKYVEDGTMLTVDTSKGMFCLAPTAEEAVVEFARTKLQSYKDLPTTFYQIGEKYRNEIRARGYLLRGKTFPMMDAYSFNKSSEDLAKTYEVIRKAYIKIFEKLGLDVIPVAADNGAMGGKKSEEFMLLSPIGEDTILYDEETGKAFNTEVLEKENYKEYLREEYGIDDTSKLVEKRAIELGHIFQLGTKYSETMNATYKDSDGTDKPYYMGCYGIGVSRTVATIYELSVLNGKDGKPNGIALPKQVAPYMVHIIPKMDNEEKVKEAEALYKNLNEKGIKAIIDDREEGSIGAKIKDCKMLGTPYIVVLGDKTAPGEIEVEDSRTGEKQLKKIEDFTI